MYVPPSVRILGLLLFGFTLGRFANHAPMLAIKRVAVATAPEVFLPTPAASVFLVETPYIVDTDGTTTMRGGTAFLLATPAGPRLVTAWHVVEGLHDEAVLVAGPGDSALSVTFVRVGEMDLAMSPLLDDVPTGWVALPQAPEVPVGHPCHIWGYGGGRNLSMVCGRVHGLQPVLGVLQPGGGYVGTDCVIVPGDSGGPAFDMEGRVFGVAAIGLAASMRVSSLVVALPGVAR